MKLYWLILLWTFNANAQWYFGQGEAVNLTNRIKYSSGQTWEVGPLDPSVSGLARSISSTYISIITGKMYVKTTAPSTGWEEVTLGVPVVPTNFLAAEQAASTWYTRSTPADSYWWGIAYGNGLFVVVASTGTGNRVMTSPDGVNWTLRATPADIEWTSIAYGNGLFVAVAITGTGNRVMTSPDGVNWTLRASAADNSWSDIVYGNGLFVAVAYTGTGNRVMTSPDGINWTARTSAANNNWSSVAYGNGLFVAVATTGTGNRVMTSPDGINWTARTSAADNEWRAVAYGNGLFVAVATSGTGNRVMISADGIRWVVRTSAADNNWHGIGYGNGVFVAVAYTGTGNRVMTSPFYDLYSHAIQTFSDINPTLYNETPLGYLFLREANNTAAINPETNGFFSNAGVYFISDTKFITGNLGSGSTGGDGLRGQMYNYNTTTKRYSFDFTLPQSIYAYTDGPTAKENRFFCSFPYLYVSSYDGTNTHQTFVMKWDNLTSTFTKTFESVRAAANRQFQLFGGDVVKSNEIDDRHMAVGANPINAANNALIFIEKPTSSETWSIAANYSIVRNNTLAPSASWAIIGAKYLFKNEDVLIVEFNQTASPFNYQTHSYKKVEVSPNVFEYQFVNELVPSGTTLSRLNNTGNGNILVSQNKTRYALFEFINLTPFTNGRICFYDIDPITFVSSNKTCSSTFTGTNSITQTASRCYKDYYSDVHTITVDSSSGLPVTLEEVNMSTRTVTDKNSASVVYFKPSATHGIRAVTPDGLGIVSGDGTANRLYMYTLGKPVKVAP